MAGRFDLDLGRRGVVMRSDLHPDLEFRAGLGLGEQPSAGLHRHLRMLQLLLSPEYDLTFLGADLEDIGRMAQCG